MVPKLRADVAQHGMPGVASEYGNQYELHCMTSATLIEALYDAVDDWLAANAPGKTIANLDEKASDSDR